MKRLIIINGTMGVGKSSVGQSLNKSIPNSAFIDGDWCCKFNAPLTDEIKNLYIENITSLLNNYLLNREVKDVIFCWVIHKNELLRKIIQNINLNKINGFVITLQADNISLTDRIIERCNYEDRDDSELKRSLYYQKNYYKNMPSYKIDTSNMSIDDVAKKICDIVADENNSIKFNNL